jgi:starch phosphorylase
LRPDTRHTDVPTRDELKQAIARHARLTLGVELDALTSREEFLAASLAVRETVLDRLLATRRRFRHAGRKHVYYLSMEFLAGRALSANLLNLGIHDACRDALAELEMDFDAIREVEPDPALGNGGLGRLAACLLESMATLDVAGYGYGINFEFGLFRQRFENGWQHEAPDVWRSLGTPWLIFRPELARKVKLYGKVEHRDGRPEWISRRSVVGVPSDLPIVGYGGRTVNHIRLYAARSPGEIDIEIFNKGNYLEALKSNILSERISKVLYPSDDVAAGRELRLVQEYFLVACALADVLERHAASRDDLATLHERVAIQLNDTHPALAIPELIRLLVDEHAMPFAQALEIARKVFAYTNHTLLPEAQEHWPVGLLGEVLPRHLELIYDINAAFLEDVEKRWPGDHERRRSLSIFEENGDKRVRMMHLAIVGSHSVNGVSKLHGELLVRDVVPHYATLWPGKFLAITNGVTPRRWLLAANPELSRLVSALIGDGWLRDAAQLRDLERYAADPEVQSEFIRQRRRHKERLADRIRDSLGFAVDPNSLFDVQVKRIHEYKRQLMNALRIVHSWLEIVEDGVTPATPRTFVFGGKAAPGYRAAKLVIKLINEIARVVGSDVRCRDALKVAFLPDYRVTLAEQIIPAADLSEQISTAGMEASGTGNMKFMMNGALTVGTLDGANVEMLDEVGIENFYLFGRTADEIAKLRGDRKRSPRAEADADPRIRRVLAAIRDGRFTPKNEAGIFDPLLDALLDRDPFCVIADLPAYLDVQQRIGAEFRDVASWTKKSLLNVARSGRFSSDRTVLEYAARIWRVAPD